MEEDMGQQNLIIIEAIPAKKTALVVKEEVKMLLIKIANHKIKIQIKMKVTMKSINPKKIILIKNSKLKMIKVKINKRIKVKINKMIKKKIKLKIRINIS